MYSYTQYSVFHIQISYSPHRFLSSSSIDVFNEKVSNNFVQLKSEFYAVLFFLE